MYEAQDEGRPKPSHRDRTPHPEPRLTMRHQSNTDQTKIPGPSLNCRKQPCVARRTRRDILTGAGAAENARPQAIKGAF